MKLTPKQLAEKHPNVFRWISDRQNRNGSYTCEIWAKSLKSDFNFRQVDKKHAKTLLEEFWIQAMTSLMVYFIDGVPQVVDGGHRWYVGLENGWTWFTCEVQFDKSKKEAWEMFYRLNGGRKSMNKNLSFKAAFKAGIPWARRLGKMIRKEGYTSTLDMTKCDFPSIGTLESLYKNGDLERALKCLKAWYKDGKLDINASGCTFLRGLRDLLKVNKDLSVPDFVACFKNHTAESIDCLATKFAGGTGKRVENKHYVAAFEFYYNDLAKAA